MKTLLILLVSYMLIITSAMSEEIEVSLKELKIIPICETTETSTKIQEKQNFVPLLTGKGAVITKYDREVDKYPTLLPGEIGILYNKQSEAFSIIITIQSDQGNSYTCSFVAGQKLETPN